LVTSTEKLHTQLSTVNYDVLNIDGTEFPNPLLYAPEAYPTNSERYDRTLEAEKVFVYNCKCSAVKSRILEGFDSRTNIFAIG